MEMGITIYLKNLKRNKIITLKEICCFILILFCSCNHVKPKEKDLTTPTSKTFQNKIGKEYFDIYKSDTILITENYWHQVAKKDSIYRKFKGDFANSLPLKNKKIFFLYNDKNSNDLINEDFCKTILEPERLALSYIAMFYGSGESRFNKTPTKLCSLRNAVNLDDHCTEIFKYYMSLGFRNDPNSLKEINSCSYTSYFKGQSVYFCYKEIILTLKENKIIIDYKAEGLNRDIWKCKWTGKFVFQVNPNSIKLIREEKSAEQYIYHAYNCSGELPPDGYVNNGKGDYYLPVKSKGK